MSEGSEPLNTVLVNHPPFPSVRFRALGVREITDGFSESNYIGRFQFGKVYRGKHGNDEVIVKVWEEQGVYKARKPENIHRLTDEIQLFTHLADDRDRPNLPLMIGSCFSDEILGGVYVMKPIDMLQNVIDKDSLIWSHRVRIALRLASVLKYFHDPKPPSLPYLIRNMDAAHIMLDEDFNPLLYDFGMICGGIFPDKRDIVDLTLHGCHGYIDPSIPQGGWSEKSDVFAYGVILLGLITKKVDDEVIRNGKVSNEGQKERAMYVYEWAKCEYKSRMEGNSTVSLIDKILKADKHFSSHDGIRITQLAIKCVNDDPLKRPTMRRVVRCLKSLLIVQNHWEIVGIGDTAKAKPNALFGIRGLMSRKSLHLPPLFQKRSKIHWTINLASLRLSVSFLVSQSTLKSKKSEPTRPVKELKIFSKDDLSSCTNGFSDVVGRFKYGRVFRGMYKGRGVTVKVWEDEDCRYLVCDGDKDNLLRDEVLLLQHPKMVSLSGVVKLIGYCDEDCVGAVYDLEPLDAVQNLLMDNEKFTWERRMKVALEFASLLESLHAADPPYTPYVLRNIDAAHIMLDKNYNPKLYDFSFGCGGIFPEYRREIFRWGCEGYCDPYAAKGHSLDDLIDVYAFGSLLLCLISKRKASDEWGWSPDKPYITELAQKQKDDWLAGGASEHTFSLVDESLQNDGNFFARDGQLVTALAMQCVRYFPGERPSSDDVVKKLQRLTIHKVQKSLMVQSGVKL